MNKKTSFYFLLCSGVIGGFFAFRSSFHEVSKSKVAPITLKQSDKKEDSTVAPESRIPNSISEQVRTQKVAEEDKALILTEILNQNNDNDPRLDTVFKNLSEEDKKSIESVYYKLPKEDLNKRGTLVFILGREIKDSKDLIFIKSVLEEKPCSNFSNCNSDQKQAQDDHHEDINSISLAYPQVVALKMLGRQLEPSSEISDKKGVLEIIKTSARSKNQTISEQAQNILNNSNF